MEKDYQEIIDNIKKEIPASPPEDFTGQVMARIGKELPGIRPIHGFLTPVAGMLSAFNSFSQRSIPRGECAFYFMLSGTFYLVLGAVLMVGIGTNNHLSNQWLLWHPRITLAAAFFLIMIGYSLNRGSESALKVVKLGMPGYLACAVMSGLSLQLALNIPRLLSFGYTMTNVLMGALLILAVQKMEKVRL